MSFAGGLHYRLLHNGIGAELDSGFGTQLSLWLACQATYMYVYIHMYMQVQLSV